MMTYISYKIVKNMTGDQIDLLNITLRNKKHQHCNIKIKDSKNSVHRGLYCCNHKKWLQWITWDQEQTLTNMGIPAEPDSWEDIFNVKTQGK